LKLKDFDTRLLYASESGISAAHFYTVKFTGLVLDNQYNWNTTNKGVLCKS